MKKLMVGQAQAQIEGWANCNKRLASVSFRFFLQILRIFSFLRSLNRLGIKLIKPALPIHVILFLLKNKGTHFSNIVTCVGRRKL